MNYPMPEDIVMPGEEKEMNENDKEIEAFSARGKRVLEVGDGVSYRTYEGNIYYGHVLDSDLSTRTAKVELQGWRGPVTMPFSQFGLDVVFPAGEDF